MANSIQTQAHEDYEDLQSLKRSMFAHGKKCITTKVNKVVATGGAGATIPIEEATGTAISQKGKTEIAVKLTGSNDDADYTDETLTLVYVDSDGVEHTAVFTMTATMNDTPIDAASAITDFYAAISATSSIAVKATQTLTIITSGDTQVWVQLNATETTAAAGHLYGVGDVYVRGNDDSASMRAINYYLKYITPWGELKYAVATTAADSTTEVRFQETSTYKGTASGVYVADFYRVRLFEAASAPASGKFVILTNADCSNVDGTGSDVYGMIEEGFIFMVSSRFMVRKSEDGRTFLAGIIGRYHVAAESCSLVITLTPKGQASMTYTCVATIDDPILIPEIIELEPGSEISFAAIDDAATGGNFEFRSIIVEALEQTAEV